MRYAILLLFGGMGALLLWLGWVKFQEADRKRVHWRHTTATVALREGGSYTLRYHAAGTPREAYGANELTLVPLVDGQRIPVIYPAAEPDQAQPTHWAHLYREVVIIAGFAAIGLFLGIGGFFSVGGHPTPLAPQEAAESAPAAPPRLATLGEPVELREPGGLVILMTVSALVLLVLGGSLLYSPESWWGRLLSWPAGVIAFVVGGLILYTAYEARQTVYRADSNGIRFHSPTRSRDIAWTQVARIVRLRRVQKEWSQTLRRNTTRTTGYTWILSSRDGDELLRFDDNLQPAADLQRLLTYLPNRTGANVEQSSE